MDPGYIVLGVLGVLVLSAVLGVALLTVVLKGIKGETVQWPVLPERESARAARERREYEAGNRSDEHCEWTGRDLAGDDLRPVGTHEEKHAIPGRARWW
ncbi:hypothetical protein [Sphaerisporangium sp. TRM90804]|uniref:hypothetical protein n=1 Tax=Sphaerisporangium sp. TRM90804 TaxID=3031113 RepID=UPI00244CA27E|nr:hypothetical protein [Sphaerisporangium sp. TRM90804]MDH2428836.1 hypothetical protein [Sphaerisporangium sp. TRM90804]